MYIQWSVAFETGLPLVDAQHRRLFSLVNECHEAYVRRAGRSLVYPVLNRLVRYVEEHFGCEQDAMAAVHYPGRLRHRKEHEHLTMEIFELNERYEAGDASVVEAMMDFLRSWLLDHILVSDRAFGDYARSRGIPDA